MEIRRERKFASDRLDPRSCGHRVAKPTSVDRGRLLNRRDPAEKGEEDRKKKKRNGSIRVNISRRKFLFRSDFTRRNVLPQSAAYSGVRNSPTHSCQSGSERKKSSALRSTVHKCKSAVKVLGRLSDDMWAWDGSGTEKPAEKNQWPVGHMQLSDDVNHSVYGCFLVAQVVTVSPRLASSCERRISEQAPWTEVHADGSVGYSVKQASK